MSILHAATRIAFGATIAGAGLSLGRDAYKKGKSNLGIIVILFIVLSFLYGIYKSGVWVAQNYPYLGTAGNIIVRTFASILGLFCYGTVLLVAIMIEFGGQSTDTAPGNVLQPSRCRPGTCYEPSRCRNHIGTSLISSRTSSLCRTSSRTLFTFDTTLGVIFCIQTGLLALGLIVGFSKRKNRQLEHDAEVHNRKFFRQHGLEEIQDDRLPATATTSATTSKNILGNELEFKVAGHMGKRAYLKFDSTGKYTSWSGVVMQR